jgi:hypothetical protein
MIDIESQREDALAILQRNVPYQIEPQLDPNDLEDILTECQRADVWQAATAYVYGDVVLPTVRNGHRYQCIQAGTSEADEDDEPTWPLAKGWQFSEGESDPILMWQEAGPDWDNVFDTRLAIHLAWMAKAAKAAQLYSTRQSGSTFEHQQVYEHCLTQAERYAPVRIA